MQQLRPLYGFECSQEPRILVCIPAYNESKTITDIILTAESYAAEIIVYDDMMMAQQTHTMLQRPLEHTA